jgi:hypothetical protein
MGRLAAIVGALVLGLAAFAVAFIGVFVAADAADPAKPDSDAEPVAIAFVLVEGALVAGVLVCLVYAVAGRFTGLRWAIGLPLVAAIALSLAIAAGAA